MKKSKSFEWNKVTPLSKYLAMVLFVALPFIAFLLGMKYQQGIAPQHQNSQTSNLITPNSADTDNWKTYTNEQYGFSFKYPADSELEAQSNQSTQNFILKLKPPAPFFLDTTTLTIEKLEKTSGTVGEMEKYFNADLHPKLGEDEAVAFSGILPTGFGSIGGRQTYAIICPEFGDCNRLDKYYVKTMKTFDLIRITVDTYTNPYNDFRPIYGKVAQKILATLSFSNQ